MPHVNYQADFKTLCTIRVGESSTDWKYRRDWRHPFAPAQLKPKVNLVKPQFDQLRKAFEEDFASIQIQYPKFRPKIRYNEDTFTIEIGYTEREFKTLFPKNGATLRAGIPGSYIRHRIIENDMKRLEQVAARPVTSCPSPSIILPETIAPPEVMHALLEQGKEKNTRSYRRRT
jgi:hypothetical protein